MIRIMMEALLPKPFDRIDAGSMQHRFLETGQTLFFQGDTTAGLYFLVTGGIDLSRTTASGHNIVVHRAREGETLAEASMFRQYYGCTAVARKESVVIECLRPVVDALLANDAGFARQVASRFASQVHASRRQVELLSIRSAEDRILLAMEEGLLNEDITTFADVVGLAPATVYRILARLVEKGKIVKTGRGQYRISF